MSEPINYVGIDAHKAELLVALQDPAPEPKFGQRIDAINGHYLSCLTYHRISSTPLFASRLRFGATPACIPPAVM